MDRRKFFFNSSSLVALGGLPLRAARSQAQPFPSKPLRIVVPYAAGGTSDILARTLAVRVGDSIGQQVIIDNRPGAASTIGLEMVAKSPPDGYTVGINNIAYGANPAIYKKMPFDSEKDFAGSAARRLQLKVQN